MARRRSTRLLSQIHASEEATGMSPRRSTRLHPQTQSSADGAGATRRRRRRGRGTSAASLPDDDGMLWEILLRLPPQPSSLPRASAVCKHWRCIVGDPKFHRQFYAHHRKPPLLGVYSQRYPGRGIVFNPILDPPDRLPPQRFDIGRCSNSSEDYDLLDCRHGRILVKNREGTEVVVHDPVTSEQHRLAVPPEFQTHLLKGAVLCAAGDQGHVHGGCHSSPFKVVLISSVCKRIDLTQTFTCVYTSRTGIWGDLTFAEAHCEVCGKHSVLLGNCLYWLSMKGDIIEFHLGEHSLTVIRGPPITTSTSLRNYQIIEAEHGAFRYALFLYPRFQMWRRDVNGHGVATWVPWKTIEMDSILKVPQTEELMPFLLGYDDDTDAIFLSVSRNIYMVHLKSMQSRKLCETIGMYRCRPFKSFYTPAIRECDEADILHDP